MLRIIGLDEAGRAEAERALFERMSLTPADVERDVRGIIEAVRASGDVAVREYTERYERRTLTALELSRDEWDALLRPADCSGEPVLDPSELRDHPLFNDAFVGETLRTYPALSSDVPSAAAPAQGEQTLADVLRDWHL